MLLYAIIFILKTRMIILPLRILLITLLNLRKSNINKLLAVNAR